MFNPVKIHREQKNHIVAVKLFGIVIYARVGVIERSLFGAYTRVDTQRAIFGVKLQKPRMPQWLHL